jgi:hypothetical protein
MSLNLALIAGETSAVQAQPAPRIRPQPCFKPPSFGARVQGQARVSVNGQRNLSSLFYPSIKGCTLPIMCWCERHSLPIRKFYRAIESLCAPASNGFFLWHILGQSRSTLVHNEVGMNRWEPTS